MTQIADRFFNTNGVAIRGYDPMGYFQNGAPTLGLETYASEYLGFTFWHATSGNRDKFLSNPAQYAPQFGGYCAFAMSKGAVASTQPEAWNIEDVSTVPPVHEVHGDLLYLNYSLFVRDEWRADMVGAVQRAHNFWPRALADYGPPKS